MSNSVHAETMCLTLSPLHLQSKSATKQATLMPTTFPLFTLLPAEIRVRIWHYALQPRLVTIHYNKSDNSITSPTAAPRLLSVNHEARYEALRFCRPSLATSTSLASVYMAQQLDSIYIPRLGAMGYDDTLRDFKSYLKDPTELDDVTELALDYVELGDKRPWETYDKSVLIRSFPRLKLVTLVLGWKPEGHGHLNGRKEEVGFGNARDDLVAAGVGIIEAENCIRRHEGEFRASWAAEEGIARDLAESTGKEFQRWNLPDLKVVGKMRQKEFLDVL